MQSQALYVVSDRGWARFIWASSAAEAKALVSDTQTAEQERAVYEQTTVLSTAPPRFPERQERREAMADH